MSVVTLLLQTLSVFRSTLDCQTHTVYGRSKLCQTDDSKLLRGGSRGRSSKLERRRHWIIIGAPERRQPAKHVRDMHVRQVCSRVHLPMKHKIYKGLTAFLWREWKGERHCGTVGPAQECNLFNIQYKSENFGEFQR